MRLRVLDFGSQSGLRSQAVYHGIAQALGPDDDPVLTLVSPDAPYVCIGMHQDLALEIDEDYCRAARLPVIRRHVGGGAVYLDADQLFFHFIYPRARAPARVHDLYPVFIEPVLRTYRELGIEACLCPVNDIHVDGRKIGGTGAAWIGNATVLVGSFLFDFDTETMVRCLRVPDEKFRDKLRAGLTDYMTTIARECRTPPAREALKRVFLRHVSRTLAVTPIAGTPTDAERAAIAECERELSDPEWTYQEGRKFVEDGVKISARAFLTHGVHQAPGGTIRVQLLNLDDRIADVALSGDFACLPAAVDALAERLRGVALAPAALSRATRAAVADLCLQAPGFMPEDITAAILACAHKD